MPDRTIKLSKLKEIATTVMYAAEAENLEAVLQRIADASRELLDARYAALGVPDGQGGLLHFKVSGISERAIGHIAHPPVGEGLLGLIMNERRSLRLDHMGDHPQAVGFPKGHPAMETLLGVPIQVSGHLFGMLYLANREDDEPFTIADQWLLETLAGYAALAIAGSELREQQHRLTLLEERQRIAMELHDGIIQSLYALGMQLDLMRTGIETPKERFQPVIDGLNTIIEEIRGFILDLRQRADNDDSFRDVLDDLVRRLYIPDSLDVIIYAPQHPMPFEHSENESICMIVREALSNVVRHSGANTVYVTARQNEAEMQITIQDDGQGFDPRLLAAQNGLGVRNMQERARLHQGKLTINSMPGEGTTVAITIPLNGRRGG
jgi:signal transduction histidine kinase